MTLRHFTIFVAVADSLNMTEAAGKLFISQSAVSQAISEMEKHYGVRLFERFSKKLHLTQAGQKLLSYARHICNMSSEAEAAMKSLQENPVIRVGASVTIGSCLLPKIVSSFYTVNPQSKIEVCEDNTRTIEGMLLQDRLDIGVVEGEVISADLEQTAFMEDELVVICSPRHPFYGRHFIEPAELEGEKFIIREEGSGTRKTFENSMAAHRLSYKPVWICNNADTIKAAVAEGLGISVISQRAVEAEVQAGLLWKAAVRNMEFKRRFQIVYHKNKYLSPAMKDFIRHCLKWE